MEKIATFQVKNLQDLLKSSSVFGSATQDTETVSTRTLVSTFIDFGTLTIWYDWIWSSAFGLDAVVWKSLLAFSRSFVIQALKIHGNGICFTPFLYSAWKTEALVLIKVVFFSFFIPSSILRTSVELKQTYRLFLFLFSSFR